MPAFWSIMHWPRCDFHVFLSHCAEDRDSLVWPVYRQLQQRNVIPWLDQHDYPAGRDPFEALRENILRCRHIVFFATPSLLRQPRGWAETEKSYSEIIQKNLHLETFDVSAVELPLFFVDRRDVMLRQSIWGTAEHRGRFKPAKRRRINWAVNEITRFLRESQRLGEEIATCLESNTHIRDRFQSDHNLWDRVIAAAPQPVHFEI